MSMLPIQRIILYKHGVGYFERRGSFEGETYRLTFPRLAMDDVLKSLVVLDVGDGHIIGLDFETPETRDELIEKGSIHLSDNHTLLDLLRDMRGRQIRCTLTTNDVVVGQVVGVDYSCDNAEQLCDAVVSLYQMDSYTVHPVALRDIHRLELLDETAHADLSYFLRAAQQEEERRSATLHLSPGIHDVLVGYIAPAPAWRVSYRMLVEYAHNEQATGVDDGTTSAAQVLFQGWGLFDNQLDEDLTNVQITLVAGMPVSFRYRLYEPKTPERPLFEDEERTVNAPLLFEGAVPQKRAQHAIVDNIPCAPMSFGIEEPAPEMLSPPALSLSLRDYSLEKMDDAVQIATTSSERGALFAYSVDHPVSVARGQSAMVPIVSQRLPCRRELLYNGNKLPRHPVASLRLHNETGLTLERGPVTVLEQGDYAGEAVVPFTRAGNEIIVPYAVELGIQITETTKIEQHTVSMNIQHDYIQVQEYDVHKTIYTVHNTLAHDVVVVVEHMPRPLHELTNTPPPNERTTDVLRWHIACPHQSTTAMTIAERHLNERQECIRNLSGKTLQAYLHHRYLDADTVQSLDAVLVLYQKIEETEKNLVRLGKERDEIHKKQGHIQRNLSPLDSKGDEGALRKRYVAELNKMEDQLVVLASEERRLKELVTLLYHQVQEAINMLQEL